MTDHDKRMFYSMGEVSEMLDVNPSLIRFWEKKFTVIKPHKNKKGNRMFTPADVDNLKLIYHLVRERGMTLDGAARALRKGTTGLTAKAELTERLLTIRSLLEDIRQELGPEDGIVIPAAEGTEAAEPAPPTAEKTEAEVSPPPAEDKQLPLIVEQTLF